MKQCTQCQRAFKPRNGRQLTCSDKCSKERSIEMTRKKREQHTRKVGWTRACDVCGVEFTTKAHNQRYCPREECKAEGLRRAVMAQQARRLQKRVEGGKV